MGSPAYKSQLPTVASRGCSSSVIRRSSVFHSPHRPLGRGDSARRNRAQSWAGVRAANAFANSAIQGTQPDARHRRERSARRGLPVSERLHAGGRQREAARVLLDSRRRLRARLRLRAAVRRLAAGHARRRRRRDHPLSPRRARLPLSRRARRREVGRNRKRGPTRSDRRARMGARQHRGVRRRPGKRDDRRRIGRIDGVRNVARDAGRARFVQARHPAERRGQSIGHRCEPVRSSPRACSKNSASPNRTSRRFSTCRRRPFCRRNSPYRQPVRRSRSRRSSTAKPFR